MSNFRKPSLLVFFIPTLILLLSIPQGAQTGREIAGPLGFSVYAEPKDDQETKDQKKKQEKKKEKLSKAFDEGAAFSKVMWRNPVDIEKRDLYYGVGGKAGAPDPKAKYTFIKESSSGTQKKIIVKDDRGREWTVKFGPEARPETSATRIVWAAGYHTDQDYFVEQARIDGAEVYDARDVRFERRNDGYKEIGPWSWKDNPMEGTRELNGLKVLMGLVNNWDLKSDNNRISREGKNGAAVYFVSDLGASFGRTGSWLNKICFLADLPPDKWNASASKGDPKAYNDEPFIEKVKDGMVVINHGRARGRSILHDIPVADALWMGELLGRLSNKQLSDAFRAGGFEQGEIKIFVAALRERINELRGLPRPERFAAKMAAQSK